MVKSHIYPNLFTFNTLIYRASICKRLKVVVGLFHDMMILKSILPDCYTFNTLVASFCKQVKLKQANSFIAMISGVAKIFE